MCLFKVYRKYRLTPKQKTGDKRRGFPGRPLGGRAAIVVVVTLLGEAWRKSSTHIQPKNLSIKRLIGAHVLFRLYYLLITY